MKLQASRFSELLVKLLSLKGQGGVPSDVSSTLSPVFDVASVLPEMPFLRGEVCAAGAWAHTAAAGQTAKTYLENRTPNLLVAVDQVVISAGTAGVANVVANIVTTTALASVGSAGLEKTDTRTRGTSGQDPTAIVTVESTVAAANSELFSVALAQGSPIVVPLRVILMEGFALQVSNTTVAASLHVAFRWREWFTDPSERV